MSKKTYLFLSFILLSCLMTGTDGEGATQQYTLTVTNTGSGNGIVTSSPAGINCPSDCTEVYQQGKKVTLKAKPDVNSSFAGWAGGGCTGINPCSVIMNDNETVVATFDLKTPKISLSTDSLEFDLGSKKKVSQTLGISNIGTGNLIVTASVEGADFSITGNSTFVIKPNKSYKLKVTYAPSASGTPEADVLATHEPTSGHRESEVEASSASGDIEPSAEGSDDQPKLKLDTNDPQNRVVKVELAPLIPVNSAKDFINVKTWQLDITWNASGNYDDQYQTANLQTTATASYLLSGRSWNPTHQYAEWHADTARSWTITYIGYYLYKGLFYVTYAPPPPSADLSGAFRANLVIGEKNPYLICSPLGYGVAATMSLPLTATVTPSGEGPVDSLVVFNLPTSIPQSDYCGGYISADLPASTSFSGSIVGTDAYPPFGVMAGAKTPEQDVAVSVQYVLKPYSGE